MIKTSVLLFGVIFTFVVVVIINCIWPISANTEWWFKFWGPIIGGVITFGGVALSIVKTIESNTRLNNDQLETQHKLNSKEIILESKKIYINELYKRSNNIKNSFSEYVTVYQNHVDILVSHYRLKNFNKENKYYTEEYVLELNKTSMEFEDKSNTLKIALGKKMNVEHLTEKIREIESMLSNARTDVMVNRIKKIEQGEAESLLDQNSLFEDFKFYRELYQIQELLINYIIETEENTDKLLLDMEIDEVIDKEGSE